jgi:HNH endonuclease
MLHEIDHIYAEKHGGETLFINLCLCCWICNRHKGSDLTSLDPETGEITPLFHPRRDVWTEHFRLNGALIEGITPQGRVTVRLLQLNNPNRVRERQLLIAMGRYP